MLDLVLLTAGGFVAGILNAVAGGGTFITFPILVFVGLDPIVANATATVSALPGYAGGAWGFRRDIGAEGALGVRGIVLLSLVGAAAGAALLLLTPSRVFDGIVPWLLLLATALFALGPRILAALRQRGIGGAGIVTSAAVILAVTTYGGYFNGGLGILLLAAFGLIGFTDLNRMNGLKLVLSSSMSIISAVIFAVAGLIAWPEGLLMAAAAAGGGWSGAKLSRRIRTDWLRAGITLVGLVLAALFFAT
ncbi:sulfite exporter TauE/SafE family protein [Profundibacterium mesophilum]|uniref:Probable membrane transporter protein n=1 Tax=Profundibacterium mesophilum KAUST100406-0324 TaxID=1037889 RepID=A0A921TBQ7_9RHOB|nr:sulfite exporter TauE/SafE family protein [Profundibacterium mesophilum]KAF0674668.1 Sulfite exporter TauE/SafE domain containing protein [Profundibacterium mesophilum KAUST100406-0324]